MSFLALAVARVQHPLHPRRISPGGGAGGDDGDDDDDDDDDEFMVGLSLPSPPVPCTALVASDPEPTTTTTTTTTTTSTATPNNNNNTTNVWEVIVSQLKHNELVELRLGYRDSAWVPGSRAATHTLAKALKHNTSLRRVSIGWYWHKRPPHVLWQLLAVLADSIRPHQLQSLQLVLTNHMIPAQVLSNLLQSQTSLSSLNLQTITVDAASSSNNSNNSNSNSSSLDSNTTNETTITNSSRSTGSTTTTTTFGSHSHHGRRSHHSHKHGDSMMTTTKKRIKKDRSPQPLHPHFYPPQPHHHPKQHPKLKKQQKQLQGFKTMATGYDSTVVPILLDSFVPNHRYQVLSELHLIDCDLDDDCLYQLADEIMPTTILSIRGNRLVTGNGAAALIRAEKASTLDLSLCDFQALDFVEIGRALRDLAQTRRRGHGCCRRHNGPVVLEHLLVRGNYRMEMAGLQHLISVAPWVVQSLDLSYCDLTEDMTICIFQTLKTHHYGNRSGRCGGGDHVLSSEEDHEEEEEDGDKDCHNDDSKHEEGLDHQQQQQQPPMLLRHLYMHGCRIRGTSATNALVALLRPSSSASSSSSLQPPCCWLRSLALDDDKNERKYLSATQIREIAKAMRYNYEMEALTIDFFKGSRDEQHWWNEIEFWQVLNRAGRRLLLRPSSTSTTTMTSSSSSSSTTVPRMGPPPPNHKYDPSSVAKALREDMDGWIQLLDIAQSEPGLESIYWVVRNSADRFGK